MPTVTLTSVKWANASVPAHLRLARLLANLKERLQIDADERAAQGDPLDEFAVEVRSICNINPFVPPCVCSCHSQ